ncbi:MAG: AraC family transcriptional regulator [Clostridia bacterium]|nr:AraC family transcriptional regulator [Clostridia bacterium]
MEREMPVDEQILAVQRMQDYIEAHLDEGITLDELARAALFSPWHARRLFIRYTGRTPADYIRRLRLSRSALELHAGRSVTEVALELGFGSVDGYQRAFFREFQCNPGEYAQSPRPLYLFTPYGVQFRERRGEQSKMKRDGKVEVQVIRKPPRKAYIRRGVRAEDYFEYCAEVGCDVWGLLVSIRALGGEPVCLWLPPRYRAPGTSRYVQGVELPPDADVPLPEGFDRIDLPECEYLQFQGEPFREEDSGEAIRSVQAAMDRYDPEALGYRWDEENPRIQLEPVGSRGYVELRAVKRRTE